MLSCDTYDTRYTRHAQINIIAESRQKHDLNKKNLFNTLDLTNMNVL